MVRREAKTSSNPFLPALSNADFKRNQRYGFTIVELLIVVVVIAILAAITIVAYNGISNRAKSSALRSETSQAVKKVLSYAVTNNDQYPSTLALAGLTDTATSYQYTVDNTAKTFCVTATSQNLSAWMSNTTPSPAMGACPGHGLNGKTSVTNYIPNPQVKTNATYWYTQTPVGNTTVRTANEGPNGEPTFNTTTASAGQLRVNFRYGAAALPVTAGEQMTVSVYFYSPHAITTAGFEMQWNTGWVLYNFGNIQAGWNRYSQTVTVPTGVTALDNVQLLTTGSANASTVFKATKAMLTRGSTLENYGDGDSPGWVWNGSGNSVTSTGSQQ